MKIFACYLEDDGFETVKNQGRHDIKNEWRKRKDSWFDIVNEQRGSETIQWINPKENLSYPLPRQELQLHEGDFHKVLCDYFLFKNNIDARKFKEKLINEFLYFTKGHYTPIENEVKTKVYDNYTKANDLIIDTQGWKTFTVGELFSTDIKKPKNKIAFKNYTEGNIPFVASGNYNNGVSGYVEARDEQLVEEGNCITISAVDGSTFYQNSKFLGRGGAGSSINILRHEKLNESIGLFLAAVIGKACIKYRFNDMCSPVALKKEEIILPTINNDPYWKYMECCIKSLPFGDTI